MSVTFSLDVLCAIVQYIEKTSDLLNYLLIRKDVRQAVLVDSPSFHLSSHFFQVRLEKIQLMQTKKVTFEYVQKLEIDIRPKNTGYELLQADPGDEEEGKSILVITTEETVNDFSERSKLMSYYLDEVRKQQLNDGNTPNVVKFKLSSEFLDREWEIPFKKFPNVEEVRFSHDYRFLKNDGRKMLLKEVVGETTSKLRKLHVYGVQLVVIVPLPKLSSLCLVECNVEFRPEIETMKPSECFPSLIEFALSGLYLGPVGKKGNWKLFSDQFATLSKSQLSTYPMPHNIIDIDEYDLLFWSHAIPFSKLRMLTLENICNSRIKERENDDPDAGLEGLEDIFPMTLVPPNVEYHPRQEWKLKEMLFGNKDKHTVFISLERLTIGNIDIGGDAFFQEFRFPSLLDLKVISIEVCLERWKPLKELISLEVIGSSYLLPNEEMNMKERHFHSVNTKLFPNLGCLSIRGSYREYLLEQFGLDLGIPDKDCQIFLNEKLFEYDDEEKFTPWELLSHRVNLVKMGITKEDDHHNPGNMIGDAICGLDFSEILGDCIWSQFVLVKIPFPMIALKLKSLRLENMILITNSRIMIEDDGKFTSFLDEEEMYDFVGGSEKLKKGGGKFQGEFNHLESLVLKNVYFSVDLRCDTGDESCSRSFLYDIESSFGSLWSDMNNLNTLSILYDRFEYLRIPDAPFAPELILRPHISEGFLTSRKFPRMEVLTLRQWPLREIDGNKHVGLFEGLSSSTIQAIRLQECQKCVVNERNRFFAKIGRGTPSSHQQIDHFKLKKISVKNFKLFNTKEPSVFNFSKFCVYVGKNGSGKSTVLLAIVNVLRCKRLEFIDLQNFIQQTSQPKENEERKVRFAWKDPNWWQYFNEEKSSSLPSEIVPEIGCFQYYFSTWTSFGDSSSTAFSFKTFTGKAINCNVEKKTTVTRGGDVKINFGSLIGEKESSRCLGNVLYLNSAYVRDFLKIEGIKLLSGGLDNLLHCLFSEKELHKMNVYLEYVRKYFQRHFSSIAKIVVGSSQTLITFKKGDENVSFIKFSQGEKMVVIYALLICWLATKVSPTKIVVLDEPDAHLHPQLIKNLFGFLEEFSRDFRAQIICASHSEVFVSCFDYKDVFHLEKDKKKKAKSIQLSSSGQVSEYLSNLGYSHEKKIENLYKFSKILHCRRLLLVEGPSDVSFVDRWLEFFGNHIDPVYTVLRSFVIGTVYLKGTVIKLPKQVFNMISDWRSVLDSLLEIQNIESDGLKKRKGKKDVNLEKLIKKEAGLRFFLFVDEDVSLSKDVQALQGMFDRVKDEGIVYHRLKMREIENYILSLCFKLLNSVEKDSQTDWSKKWKEKLTIFKKTIVEKHNSHFAPPDCFVRPPQKKEKKKGGKKKRWGGRRKRDKSTPMFLGKEDMLNDGKPIKLFKNDEELKNWFVDKGIVSKVISENDQIPESTLQYVEAKSILHIVFGTTKYLKSSWEMIKECPMFKRNPQEFLNEDIRNFLDLLKSFYFREVNFFCSEFDENDEKVCDVPFAHGYLLPTFFPDMEEFKFFVNCVDVELDFGEQKVCVKSTPSSFANISNVPKRKEFLQEIKPYAKFDEIDYSISFSQKDVVHFLAHFSDFRKKDGKMFSLSKNEFERILKGKVKWLTIKFSEEAKPSLRSKKGFVSRGQGVDGVLISFPKEEFEYKINRKIAENGKVLTVTFHCGVFKKVQEIRLKKTKRKETLGGNNVVILEFYADISNEVEEKSELLYSSLEPCEEETKRVRFQIDVLSSIDFEYQKYKVNWKATTDKNHFEIQIFFLKPSDDSFRWLDDCFP